MYTVAVIDIEVGQEIEFNGNTWIVSKYNQAMDYFTLRREEIYWREIGVPRFKLERTFVKVA